MLIDSHKALTELCIGAEKDVPVTQRSTWRFRRIAPRGSRRLKNSLKHTSFEVAGVRIEPYAVNVVKVRHGSDLIRPRNHQRAEWWNGLRPLRPGPLVSHRQRSYLPSMEAELRRCRRTLRTPVVGSPVPRRSLQKPLIGHGVSGNPKGKAVNSALYDVETAYSPPRLVP
jgi:hypothetical protein